ncbi:divisome protein SepX/GlpR [Streptomyces acidicola]|uniref:divisome protein SepX/GlpR n=1 Tax=Streptomyces acidicola TaxID=2596892 RepID=UPI00381FAC08
MSSSGLIYAVIVGAWAAYLVPMWLRRQDELNEARPTERFSTAIRLLSGRAGMERRYAKDLQARSTDEGERNADPDAVTDSVDVRAYAMPPYRPQTRTRLPVEPGEPKGKGGTPQAGAPAAQGSARSGVSTGARSVPQQAQPGSKAQSGVRTQPGSKAQPPSSHASPPSKAAGKSASGVRGPRGTSAESAARARRLKVLARRRRTTVMLFLAFTCGAIVAAVGGLAFLWAPGVPAVLLSAYIAYLRTQERRRFAYTMDRRRAEVAAQRLRERQPRRRPTPDVDADEPEDGPETGTNPGLSALAADRRALVEQTDHAEWVDQQRERQRRPGQGDSWDPVPVPLPTYVTAPVAPRATPDVDLGAPDSWSSARSSAVGAGTTGAAGTAGTGRGAETSTSTGAAAGQEPESSTPAAADTAEEGPAGTGSSGDGRCDARRAASARRARERGRTPLFDQYEDGDRPRAANE